MEVTAPSLTTVQVSGWVKCCCPEFAGAVAVAPVYPRTASIGESGQANEVQFGNLVHELDEEAVHAVQKQ
jgi:hypothetical protein